jgi:hypothetical protein
MKELNIALIAGQIVMLLPIWSIETRLQYITTYAGITTIIFFVLLELKDKTKRKSHAATTTTRLNVR